MFLTFEGIDGTGKSTQCRLLVEWLRERGHDVVHCIEPGTTDLGRTIREWILHRKGEIALRTEAMLFMAARAELVEQVIRPALHRGAIVVSDRYLLSTIVYQGHAGGLDVSEVRRLGLFATGGLLPDRTFILDLPVDEARLRLSGVPDRMESRPQEFHERVRRGFLSEAERDPDHCCTISAAASIESIQLRIRSIVAESLDELATHPRA